MHFLSSKLQRDVTTQQLSYSSSESENDTFLTILCCQVCWLKTRTTNVQGDHKRRTLSKGLLLG